MSASMVGMRFDELVNKLIGQVVFVWLIYSVCPREKRDRPEPLQWVLTRLTAFPSMSRSRLNVRVNP